MSVTMQAARNLEGGDRNQVNSLPENSDAGAVIDEGEEYGFGSKLGNIQAKGDLEFLTHVAQSLAKIAMTATGVIAFDRLAHAAGSTKVMQTLGSNRVDSKTSVGKNLVVAFNTTTLAASLNEGGRVENIPLDVALFHEVLHTMHIRGGTEAGGTYQGSNPMFANTRNHELQVIGLDRWRASGLTENAYRRERGGLSLRASHRRYEGDGS